MQTNINKIEFTALKQTTKLKEKIVVKRSQLAYLAEKFAILPLASLLGSFRKSQSAMSIHHIILPFSIVHSPIIQVELSLSVAVSIFPVSDVVGSI